MAAAFAASLGAIAMATAIIRGTFAGQDAADCIVSGLVALVIFSGLGWLAGMAMDHLVHQDIEIQYRRRLDQFRKEVDAAGVTRTSQASDSRQDA
jgi:hypothetical protein